MRGILFLFFLFKMDKTSITVSKKNANRLNKMKYSLQCRTIDEVLDKILKLITKFKLADELK